MRITIVFLIAMMASITAHAQADFSLSPGSSVGTVTISPNAPQSPFFLHEIWKLQPNGSWAILGTTYQSYPYTDNVSQGGAHTYRTRWYNPSGSQYNRYSSFSPNRTITISISSPPSAAPSLSVPSTETNDGQFNVSWSAVGGATRYKLERRSGSSSWSTISNGSQRSVSQTLANGSYSYRVLAANNSGEGPLSTARTINVNVSNVSPPAAPATTFSPTYGVIVWTASDFATYYQLRVGSTTVYSGPNTSYYTGSSTSSWSVRACNSGGCSNWKYR